MPTKMCLFANTAGNTHEESKMVDKFILTLITIWLSAWIITKKKYNDGNSWWFKIVTNQT